jgi:uncharacterized SAM-binding protein YcdF (DUF218 family)
VPSQPRARILGKVGLAALVALLALFVGTAISIYSYPLPTAPEHADAAIVLGAAVWGDQPSPVFEERILHAIDLYKAGAVDYIIFTGGRGEGDSLSEAEAGAAYAVATGVPAYDIMIETLSTVTYENLSNAQRLGHERGLSTYLIVSDPLHMKRSVEMAHDLGMNAYPSPTPSTRFRTWRTTLPFLVRETYFYLSYRVQALFSKEAAATQPI